MSFYMLHLMHNVETAKHCAGSSIKQLPLTPLMALGRSVTSVNFNECIDFHSACTKKVLLNASWAIAVTTMHETSSSSCSIVPGQRACWPCLFCQLLADLSLLKESPVGELCVPADADQLCHMQLNLACDVDICGEADSGLPVVV